LLSPYFDGVRHFSKVETASSQVILKIEENEKLTIKDIRAEFNKIIEDFNKIRV
jgi:hypothetical protein